MNPEDLRSFWGTVAGPDKATLVVAGAVTDERALALAESAFGTWQSTPLEGSTDPGVTKAVPGPADHALPPGADKTLPSPKTSQPRATVSPRTAPAPRDPGPTRILLVDWPGANQSELIVGGLGITNRDPDKPIANLVSSYFGGTFGSRLMKAIRVESGATYGVSGGFDANRFTGSFTVWTFTKTASTAETLRAVLAEVRGLIEHPPTPEELALHKRAFLGGAAARFEKPKQTATLLTQIALNDLPLDQFQRSLARINSATAAECREFVRRVVNAARLVIVVVGDAHLIAEDLTKIAPVTSWIGTAMRLGLRVALGPDC